MAERSFVEEVKKLRLGEGEVFSGEGILAVTKALLESGVAYVAGYQGAPISHLMDVLADAQDILAEHGIRFENSASEATAAATLAASVNYPLRGAVTFKSTVGTNVASDALANLASGGVKGGAVIIVGEDYGEGSSIMQERSHAFAMKSQIWLLDPRPNLPSIVSMVKQAFELSEASNTPVMVQLRIRACHVHGQFVAGANQRSEFTLQQALEIAAARRRPHRAAAGQLRARAREDPRALARCGALHPGARAQRVLLGEVRRHRHRRAGRQLQHPAARARARGPGGRLRQQPRSALRDERRLSRHRRRGAALLRRQAGGADGGGGPAQLHRAEHRDHPAPGGLGHRLARQGRAADGGRILLGRNAEGRSSLLREARPARAGRGQGASQGPQGHPGQGLVRKRARAAARLLHRLPGAPDLHGDEARRARDRRAPCELPTSAATCSRSCRPSTWATPPWATA